MIYGDNTLLYQKNHDDDEEGTHGENVLFASLPLLGTLDCATLTSLLLVYPKYYASGTLIIVIVNFDIFALQVRDKKVTVSM